MAQHCLAAKAKAARAMFIEEGTQPASVPILGPGNSIAGQASWWKAAFYDFV
jgi:hypothetical protein